jgi:hypothetical protein
MNHGIFVLLPGPEVVVVTVVFAFLLGYCFT